MSRIVKRVILGMVRGAGSSMYINLSGEVRKTKVTRSNNIARSWENVGMALSKRLQRAN